jgi:predicted DsbA family dithiol-disulfide isomerase
MILQRLGSALHWLCGVWVWSFGRGIGKNEVLTQIGDEAGCRQRISAGVESDKGLEEVLEEEAKGKQRGLNGVPA